MKILKILASNSKRFRVYDIFKIWKIEDDRDRGSGQILHFLRSIPLKVISGLKDSPGYVFWLKKLKNDFKLFVKLTGITL